MRRAQSTVPITRGTDRPLACPNPAPLPALSHSPPLGCSRAGRSPRGGSGSVGAQQFPPEQGQGGAGSSTQLDLNSPALRGLWGCVGSPGLLPAPLLVGGLWLPVWLTQPLALGEAFVSAALGCGLSLRRRRGLAGLGGGRSFPAALSSPLSAHTVLRVLGG